MSDKMPNREEKKSTDGQSGAALKRDDLPAPALRALKEAEERRIKLEAEKVGRPKEIGGRGGEDPARYGDWEVKGIACDF